MKGIVCDKTHRWHAFIKVLGIMVLALLMLVSITGAAPFAYITSYDPTNTVSVVDIDTNTVVASVIGAYEVFPYGVAVNPSGTKVYVTCTEDTPSAPPDTGIVSVISTATNTIIATVPVGLRPEGVAVTSDGKKAYVANSFSGTVSVIDTSTNTVTTTINVGGEPHGVAVNPEGAEVYVTRWDTPFVVSVIDTATNTVTASVNVGDYPKGIAVTPDGAEVYVVTQNGVCVIDTATSTVVTRVPVENWPFGVAVTPDGSKVYVTDSWNKCVCIDTTSNTVTDTIEVGWTPQGVAVTPDGTEVYVANAASGTVSVIDIATNTVINTVDVGTQPIAFGQFISPLSPVQKIQQMIITVQNLVTSGELNQGQSNALISKLDAAVKNLNAENKEAAINELTAFINQVNAYIQSEMLSSIQGQLLIDDANSVINAIK